MKILVIHNLSILTLPIIFFFRILNFKIIFISIDRYFQNKKFLNFLKMLNINWFNYQVYKINNAKTEQMAKVADFCKNASIDITKNFWNNKLEEIYINKFYLGSCLSRYIHIETLKLIEIMFAAKTFEVSNNKIFLWAPKNLISKKLNAQFYKIKNINILPNINIKILLSILTELLKIIINTFYSKLFKKSKKNNYFSKNHYLNDFKVACYPHKGVFYNNLFIKDYFYSYDEKDPFYYKKILHLEWENDEITKNSLDYYVKNDIKYIFLKLLTNNFYPFKKTLLFWLKNINTILKLSLFDLQVTYFFLISSFRVIKATENLSNLNNLKMIMTCSDVLFPIELSVACKKLKILTVALEDRLFVSAMGYDLIYDFYFVAGNKSKNILKKRMPAPYINNVKDLYLVKTDKYVKDNSIRNSDNKFRFNCIVMNYQSSVDWYDNGRSPLVNWRLNKDFCNLIIQLADSNPDVNFLIKSKNYKWIKIPFFEETVNDFSKRKNITILLDQKKWTPIETLKVGDFAISCTTSLAEEMLLIGKPVIIYDGYNGFPRKVFDYGDKIVATNYNEILEKLRLIKKDLNSYNLSLNDDRDRLFYKRELGKLNKEMNKIYSTFCK